MMPSNSLAVRAMPFGPGTHELKSSSGRGAVSGSTSLAAGMVPIGPS